MLTKMAGIAAVAVLVAGCTSSPVGDSSGVTGTPADTVEGSRSPSALVSEAPEAGASTMATRSESPPTPDPARDLPLIEAAGEGDETRVATLLRRGGSVRATDDRGRTPLIAAAYGNHVRSAEVLLDAGADPNEKDRTVQSAYLISTSEVGDDPDLLDLLLDNGADVNSRDSFNGTGLIRAADRGFPRIVDRLLETDVLVDHVNRLGWTALHEAIILGDGGSNYVRVVELLVGAGADVTLPSALDGVTPLAHAQRLGHDAIARVLMDAGATE